eukprot:4159425-Prymnesium_polylepis.2
MSQRRVLAVNHVFDILLQKSNGGEWGDALLCAMPQRRGAALPAAAGACGEEEDLSLIHI